MNIFMRAFVGLVLAFGMVMPANAQTGDPRVFQLEDQVRQLTGRVEELNFLIIELQERMRLMQEDIEFRIQDMENSKQGALGVAPETDFASNDAEKVDRLEDNSSVATIINDNAPDNAGTGNAATVQGAPPRSLGTLTLDDKGNVLDTSVDFSAAAIDSALDGAPVASITGAQNPEELYETGYGHVLNGDYALAEEIFASFLDLYPDDILAGNAQFWLSESVLSQGRFEDAAALFVDGQTLYPESEKAPERLYKIGAIMADLGNRDVACATFSDALTQHGDMAVTIRSRIEEERAKAQC